MSDTLREAAQLLGVELTVEIANAPAPNYEEDDYAAGYVAGLAFALEKLDTILAVNPADTETEARRLKRTQLAVIAVMNGLGWKQMDTATRAAAIVMNIDACSELINGGKK